MSSTLVYGRVCLLMGSLILVFFSYSKFQFDSGTIFDYNLGVLVYNYRSSCLLLSFTCFGLILIVVIATITDMDYGSLGS